jgi:hypothetical protein
MLAVHWSPVKNTKHILRNGIRKSKDGTFCFPLTGNPNLDKWWANTFRYCRPRTAYNGFVFRIVEDDLPASFGDWLSRKYGGLDKEITSIAQIEAELEKAILFRIGERQFGFTPDGGYNHTLDMEKLGREMVTARPALYLETLNGDPGFLEYIFANYEIILSRSIAPSRIMHILSGGNDYGRNVMRKKKEKAFRSAQFERE